MIDVSYSSVELWLVQTCCAAQSSTILHSHILFTVTTALQMVGSAAIVLLSDGAVLLTPLKGKCEPLEEQSSQ